MPLVLNEEQRMLRDTARDFLADNAPVTQMRQLRDEGSQRGYDSALWQQMIEMGWPAVAIDEAYNGFGLGHMALGAILEEAGKTLAHSPFYSSAMLAATAISEGGSVAQRESLLPLIAAGQLTMALAHEESNHHIDPSAIALSATRDGDSWKINGSKNFVAEGANADKLLVSVRSAGSAGQRDGVSLVLIDSDSDGLRIESTPMIDSRNYADIHFDNVSITGDNFVGTIDTAFDLLDKILDYGRIGLAAEMLGGCQAMLDKTLEYLNDREQFGQKIGSFQALQHRAAKMYAELELTRSTVVAALSSIDENSEQLPLMASLAKARANETYRLITDETVQMHGGIGVTDELDVGFYLKHCRVCLHRLGDSGFHKERYAQLVGI